MRTSTSQVEEIGQYSDTELAVGKTLKGALKLTDNNVIQAAGGIPARKAQCSLLAIEGLHQAILNYRSR